MFKKLSLLFAVLTALSSSVYAQTVYNHPVQTFATGDATVTGTPASLAASASVDVKFDLGPNWAQYSKGMCSYAVASPSSGGVIQIWYGRAFGIKTWRGVQLGPTSNTNYDTPTSAGGNKGMTTGPIERYVTVSVQNTDAVNAMGASSHVVCTFYPN